MLLEAKDCQLMMQKSLTSSERSLKNIHSKLYSDSKKVLQLGINCCLNYDMGFSRVAEKKTLYYQRQVDSFTHNLKFKEHEILDTTRQQIKIYDKQIDKVINKKIFKFESDIKEFQIRLARKDMRNFVEAGFTRLFGTKGNIISIDDVENGELIKARLRDGTLALRVEKNIR